MCRLLHVEWRCKHTQNIWEYCRDATAPSRTPSADLPNTPCESFIATDGADPKAPTQDEYRNFCCKFVCCLEDQADVYKQVQDLEAALGMKAEQSVPHVPSLFLSRQQKSLKELRRKFQALAKRHEERCEALYYGLGVVQDGHAWTAPAGGVGKRHSRNASGQQFEDKGEQPGLMAKASDEKREGLEAT